MAGLLQFDPNDPRVAAAVMGAPQSGLMPYQSPDGSQDLTLAPAVSANPGPLQGVPDVQRAPTGLSGLLSGLKDATYTPDQNGMTFWDKIGAFGQTLQHAQAGIDGRLNGGGGSGDPGMATIQAFKDRAAAAQKRQEMMAVADQLNLSPREKLVFLANPEEWSKENAKRYGFHTIGAGDTGQFGEGGPSVMANKFYQNGNVTGMQTAGGTQNVQAGPLSSKDVAEQQNALSTAITANKPQVVSEGASLVQSGVAPALVPGMPGAQGMPTGGDPRVLYKAPKTFAPTAGGAEIGLSATDDDLITNLAQQVAAGGNLPSLGVGKSAVALKTAILSRAAQIQKAGGIDGFNALYGKGDLKAQTAALTQAMKTRQAMETAETTMLKTLEDGLAVARKGGVPSNAFYNHIPFVSDLVQGSRLASKNPDAQAAHGFISTAAEELAKLTSGATGGAAATDSSRAQAHGRLNDALPLSTLEAAAATARKEAHNKVLAQKQTEDDLRRRIIEGSYGQNTSMGAAVGKPVTADALRARSAATRAAAAPKAETWVPGPNGIPVLSK